MASSSRYARFEYELPSEPNEEMITEALEQMYGAHDPAPPFVPTPAPVPEHLRHFNQNHGTSRGWHNTNPFVRPTSTTPPQETEEKNQSPKKIQWKPDFSSRAGKQYPTPFSRRLPEENNCYAHVSDGSSSPSTSSFLSCESEDTFNMNDFPPLS